MFFQRCKTPGNRPSAYIIGEKGNVAIVDPRRDVEEYLDILTANGLHLDYIFEPTARRTSSSVPPSCAASPAPRW